MASDVSSATLPAPGIGDLERVLHLRSGGVSLVLDARGDRMPRVLHWGADLGDLTADDLTQLCLASVSPVVTSVPDAPLPVGMLPESATGWPGLPGLSGHRDGRDWSPLFTLTALEQSTRPDGAQCVTATGQDPSTQLTLCLELELTPAGVVRARATVENDGPAGYALDGLLLALPVPSEATELLDLTGRHLRERSPQRTDFAVGMRLREGRRGRTGLDATLVMAAGEAGFSFAAGEVWALHVAWSGNHRSYAERLPDGRAVLGGGELLLPGEIRLATGERYQSPWLYAVYGSGLDEVSARVHGYLRARPSHPRNPRPVVLNTWEAVYFDHSLDKLIALADAAAEVGAERYVLDDGWMRYRRDDTAGLGDWYPDEVVWPHGLSPLVEHVHGLGLQFGLWVEPEMINLESDLARAHPDWIMATGDRMPLAWRSQQVLDLTHPQAYEYILDRLSSLVAEYRIDYLKWDHNRDLIEAGHQPTGRPAVHEQTLATYALMDELRRRFPELEIESCSSGGGRVDLAVLERTDRVWGSDCNDALERQSIQRWTQLLLPPELIGSHVGPASAHTTGRKHDLSFRAGTALFGHFGIEWDIVSASPQERQELARWIVLYKEVRHLLHTGRVVRAEHPDPALSVHGVVAQDGSEALFAIVTTATAVTAPPGRIRLPGLDSDHSYRVVPQPPGDHPVGIIDPLGVPWLNPDGVTLPGQVLVRVGLQAPELHPEQILLLRVVRQARKGE
ncbi:MAG TPA: alpha-galactosidase [Kineosporiaceae bacterium]|nr:alpha-galactosidase [Kineosporiaceae bacterium]